MDLRGKFKTFLEDSKQKLLLSPTSSQDGDAPLPRLVLPPPGSARSALTDSDLEVSQLLSDPLADQQILDLIPSQYFRPGSGLSFLSNSVQDPHVFGPPGSGSISKRYEFGSGSFYQPAKIVRKA
jgi:hypothetical protein